MVKDGEDFVVYDAKSGEDITRSVLTQIIFEQEGKEGQNLLPITFLRQLIRFYGDSMQALVPSYLEFSMQTLSQNQQKFREQMIDDLRQNAVQRARPSTPWTSRRRRTWRCSATRCACSRRSDPGAAPEPGGEAQPSRPRPSSRPRSTSSSAQLTEVQKRLDKLSGG